MFSEKTTALAEAGTTLARGMADYGYRRPYYGYGVWLIGPSWRPG